MKKTLPVTALLLSIPVIVAAAARDFKSPAGYHFSAPAGWKIDTSGKMHTDVIVYAPPSDGFTANLNVKMLDLEDGETLAADTTAMNEINPRMFKQYTVISQEPKQLDGVPSVWTVATYHLTEPMMTLRMTRVEAINNGKVYYFDCTELDNKRDKVDPAFKTMLQSVRWTAAPGNG
jgi:hypothetical protein